ncbi:carboxypeptidase M32 [Halogeometricum sp. S1BR25-6]|uniref:Metal-dependent carboxypeptidase n=1 Tax=Halogeometricum salsisoli TaxID=2950536 RepID=A0ABU2GC22_9EURY|nr:carboxypeptidase M32 [Halogeometricum sp. S1BR25-6]MDS0297668.1 carboxypeptidase M32 [Halogeometricum sp. S1BR25-6]
MSSTDTAGGDGAYDALLDYYRRVSNLRQADGILMWDQQTTMPAGGTPARAEQRSTLSSLEHELLADDELGRLLDRAAEAATGDAERAAVREIRRQHERAVRVPDDVVADIARVESSAHETWVDAKAEDDFDALAPTLERIVDLYRERAEHLDASKHPFEAIYGDSEPFLPLSTVEEIFEDLKATLVPLVEEIRAAEELPTPFDGTYDEASQTALSEDVLDRLGYDWTRGRLDTAAHPFTFGNQFDCRVTTRFDESDPLAGLTSTVHEFGHATYNLGLPDEHYATPLGESGSHGVHESQSRFFENHVGRSKPFWEGFVGTVNDRLGSDATAESAYAAVNRVKPDTLVRVEADELTYHLHILVRFETEKALLGGDIEVSEVPAVWNDKMKEYLGVRPETDSEGCLQDIHWTAGYLAAFQNYTVGSVLAAQLDAAMREDVDDVDGLIRAGEFGPIHEWLGANVHRHGRRYPTDELVVEATGEPLSADTFCAYATEKFESLYGL